MPAGPATRDDRADDMFPPGRQPPAAGRPPLRAMESALARLRDLIVAGELSAGDRLPSEPDLSLRLGVSRSSLREAVRTLVTLGIIEVRHGDGTYVTQLEPAAMFRNFGWAVQLVNSTGVLELLEVRRVLEAQAAARTAARMTDEISNQLHKIVDEMDSTNDSDQLSQLDAQFHQIVNNACGNDTLAVLAEIFHRREHRLKLYDALPNIVRIVTSAGHHAILDALDRRDAAGAAAAAASHAQQTEQWLRTLYQTDH